MEANTSRVDWPRLENTSFDRSIDHLRNVKGNRRAHQDPGQNKSFVSQQLCALEHKNKICVTKLAKIRRNNSQLENDNHMYRDKQISMMVEHAANQQKLKSVTEKNIKLKKEVEAKKNILKYAFLLREQFDNVMSAIDSVQNGNNSDFSLNFQIPNLSNDANLTLNNITERSGATNSIYKENRDSQKDEISTSKVKERFLSSSITQRPRRVMRKQPIVEDKALENGDGVLSVNRNDYEDQHSPKFMSSEKTDNNQMSLLAEEEEFSQSDGQEILNDCEDLHALDLNISADSDFNFSVNHGRPSCMNLNLNISGSSHSLVNESLNDDCDEIDDANNDCDVMNGNVRSENVASVKNAEISISETTSPNCLNLSDNSDGENSDSVRTPRNPEHTTSEDQNVNEPFSNLNPIKPKAKQSKGTSKFGTKKDLMNKTAYDFLSCSSDSFILDENKRIKLNNYNDINKENSAPRRTGRRAASGVSYAEPNLKGKLRRGDKIADDSLFTDAPQSPQKRRKKKNFQKTLQNRA